MTTVARTDIEEKRSLQPVAANNWWSGFGNLLTKELSQWWRTNLWWVQIIIWVFILDGVSTIVALSEPLQGMSLLQEVVQTFLPMSVGAVAIGTVITVQGAIVGEKQLGTAAWVMSKPASRAAFILSKALAYALGFMITAVFVPALIFVIMVRLVVPEPLPIMPFLFGVGVAIVSLLFYVTLTLMLGTIFNSRGPIAGIGIAFIMTGLLLKGFVPLQVLLFTPWLLPDLSGALALQMPLPDGWFIALLASGFYIVLFTAVALWRFSREEF